MRHHPYLSPNLPNSISEMGRSQIKIRCPHCGHEQWVYLWSWAGHGWTRCQGCDQRIPYMPGH